jgi:hypothetical protein
MPDTVSLAIIPTIRTPVSLCWREGGDLARLAQAADRLEIPIYRNGAEATAQEMAETRASAGPGARIGFILRPTWPTLNGPEELDAARDAASDAGADSVAYYNYGHLRLESLEWIGMRDP